MIEHSKSSLHAFYADALRSGRDTAENLRAPTCERFNRLLGSLPAETPRTALDLGYGAGVYTRALARAGFDVTAVDQISSESLRGNLKFGSEAAGRIVVEECLIEEYPLTSDFGIVVAKDVLHYLSKQDAEAVLERAVTNSHSRNVHYLEVFTGISRTAASGESIYIEGEASYTSESFTDAVERIYRDWELTLLWDEHAERDVRTRRTYLEAMRATVVARRRNTAGRSATGE